MALLPSLPPCFQGPVTFKSGFAVNSSMLEVQAPQRQVLQDTGQWVNGTLKGPESGVQRHPPLASREH